LLDQVAVELSRVGVVEEEEEEEEVFHRVEVVVVAVPFQFLVATVVPAEPLS
jgi:hypothetical protein